MIPDKTLFTLNGVNITQYVLRGVVRKTKQPVKTLELFINKKLLDVMNVDNIIGKTIIMQRGFAVATERYVFRGEVLLSKQRGAVYELTCVCKMYRARRLETDYVYDIDIDSEAGVGSEIVKSLYNNIGLSYSSVSVPTTGVVNTIKIFLAKGKTIKSLEVLQRIYGRDVFYRDSDDLVYFIERSGESTSTVLETGVDIVGRIEWKSTGEDIVNNLTVVGGRQLDWASESFAGPETEILLTAAPVDTEIIADSVRLERGVNSSDPKDFYVDSTNKKIIFSVSRSNIVARYSYSVPIKVNYTDNNSISSTFRVDDTVIDTKLLNSDDAELYAEGFVNDTKDVLTNAPLKVIGNNDLEIGQEINIKDYINNKDVNVNVISIDYYYPYRADSVGVGRSPTDLVDNNNKISDRLTELERQMSTTSDINVSLIPNEAVLGTVARLKIEVATMDADTLYWDSDTQGDWDDFDWGDDNEESYSVFYEESGY